MIRAVKGIFSDVDGTITGFSSSFDRLQLQFKNLSDINIEASVLRVVETLEGIGTCTIFLAYTRHFSR